MYYEINKKDPEYVICLCRNIKRKDVVKFALENNIRDLKELCEKMPVGDRCGGCREDLEKLLEELEAE